MTVDRIVASISGPWGIVITLSLIALLIGREVAGSLTGKGATRWRRGLSLGVAPLLLVFAVVVTLRLLGPIQAVLGAASDTESATTTTSASVMPSTSASPTATTPAPVQAVATAAPPTTTPPIVAAATPAATTAPAAALTPLATPDGTALVALVRTVRADVRRGTVETTLDYGDGITSVTTVTFDLGDGQQLPRLLLTTTYKGATGSRTVRRLTIGSQTWQRGAETTWVRQATPDDIRAQVTEVLPQLSTNTVAVAFMPARVATLRWYEATRDADTALQVDAATGVPQEERRTIRAGGPLLVVRYLNWNGPVDIPNLAP